MKHDTAGLEAFMNTPRQYSIPWKGLKEGSHRFDFKVDGRFFEAFEQSVIKDGNADVAVELERLPSMLSLEIRITGSVAVECDRCLGDLQLPVEYSGALQVKFSEEVNDYDGEVLWISPQQSELELGQYIYESILLSLPYQRVHEEGECDPDMLARFTIISGEEFDKMTAEAETLENTPEGAKLRSLKEKLEK